MGKAYCRGFAESGAAVVIADIDKKTLKKTASEFESQGFNVLSIVVDVANEESVTRMLAIAQQKYKRVDFLINNAAMLLNVEKPFKPFWECSYEEWNRYMAVNVGGIFLCCKHIKPLLERQGGGRIINISSDAIWKGYESQLAYFASKGAVAVMTRNLAREFGPLSVNVNCIAPGYTLSESCLSSPEMQRVEPLILASQCLTQKQYPEDVVGAALFLCGPASRCITGQAIVINNGAIMP